MTNLIRSRHPFSLGRPVGELEQQDAPSACRSSWSNQNVSPLLPFPTRIYRLPASLKGEEELQILRLRKIIADSGELLEKSSVPVLRSLIG
jgi:hypothetical protein